MRKQRTIEVVVLAAALLAGAGLFVRGILLSDTVPAEFRSASPGFGWKWDFDYQAAMRDAGRLGARPWPWPATETGSRMVLPLGQSLRSEGLKMTYRGMTEDGRFRLDLVIENLDAGVTYRRAFAVAEARDGFRIGDRRFALVKITPLYVRLRSANT